MQSQMMGAALSIVAGITTALVSVGMAALVRDYKNCRKTYTALLSEFGKNEAICETNIEGRMNNRLQSFSTPFSDAAYETFLQEGMYRELDDGLANDLFQAYTYISGFNSLVMPGAAPQSPSNAYKRMQDLNELLSDLGEEFEGKFQEKGYNSFKSYFGKSVYDFLSLVQDSKYGNMKLFLSGFLPGVVIGAIVGKFVF